MKHTTKLFIAAAITAAFAAGAHAQGKSEVNLKNAAQTQVGGLANKQSAAIGNVQGEGKSKVNASNIAQTQVGGLANKQTMDVGNVK
jgi:hypothetical protein